MTFVSPTGQAMFLVGGVVVVVGGVGGVIGLAVGSGFGLMGVALAGYAAWRIGWTGYRLDVVGDNVVRRAPMNRLTYPRSAFPGVRGGAFDLNVVLLEVGADGALPFWRSAGLRSFLDEVVHDR